MDSKNIVQQGEEVKYKITINHQNFVMSVDNFYVRLTWGMLKKQMVIRKNQMISNAMDEWFFMFPTDEMVGRVTVECFMDVPDNDFHDKFRTEVDRQYLCFVATNPFPNCVCVPAPKPLDNTVVYERTEESDVEELYMYLQDRLGRNLLTSDEENIIVLKHEI